MRRDDEFFGERELHLVYIAKRLKEAQRLEGVFSEAGIDYLVEPDKYKGGIIFPSERVGAFFYVEEARLEETRTLMANGGWTPYQAG